MSEWETFSLKSSKQGARNLPESGHYLKTKIHSARRIRVCDTKAEFLVSRSKTVLANQMQMGEEREGGGGG